MTGVVVRALASHHWSLGSIHRWVEFVIGSPPCSEGFFTQNIYFSVTKTVPFSAILAYLACVRQQFCSCLSYRNDGV